VAVSATVTTASWPGMNRYCDGSADGRDMSHGETELDRWISSYAHRISHRSQRPSRTVGKAIRRRAIGARPSLGEGPCLQRCWENAAQAREWVAELVRLLDLLT
jgi:hypothetical protein